MFEFAWPWLFLLLPLPWLLQRFTAPHSQQSVALNTPFYDALKHLQRTERSTLMAFNKYSAAYILIWLLVLSAAARPQLQGDVQERPRTGRDLLIAVDLSSSMLYSDMSRQGMSISRMEFVQDWLDNFISQRQGDRLGLILFGSQAYLQAPLTYDQQSIRTWLAEAQPGIAGNTTAIGDAIGLAIKRLRMQPAEQRVLILITDGANTSGVMSPRAAAQLATDYHIKIYTVGVGQPISDTTQQLIDTAGLELDEQTLIDIAAITHGQYFHISNSQDLAHIQDSLTQLEPSTALHAPTPDIQELYHWPLAAAWLLSMLMAAVRLYSGYRQRTTEVG